MEGRNGNSGVVNVDYTPTNTGHFYRGKYIDKLLLIKRENMLVIVNEKWIVIQFNWVSYIYMMKIIIRFDLKITGNKFDRQLHIDRLDEVNCISEPLTFYLASSALLVAFASFWRIRQRPFWIYNGGRGGLKGRSFTMFQDDNYGLLIPQLLCCTRYKHGEMIVAFYTTRKQNDYMENSFEMWPQTSTYRRNMSRCYDK